MASLRTRLGAVFESSALATAYRLALRSPEGTRFVLPDLMEYTGVFNAAPAHSDLFAQGRAAGRRDVGLRIVQMLSLSDEEIAALLTGRDILQPADFTR